MIQGYLDAMGGKENQNDDPTYKAGYDLAKLVQEGKAQAPSWATESSSNTSTVSEETEREG